MFRVSTRSLGLGCASLTLYSPKRKAVDAVTKDKKTASPLLHTTTTSQKNKRASSTDSVTGKPLKGSSSFMGRPLMNKKTKIFSALEPLKKMLPGEAATGADAIPEVAREYTRKMQRGSAMSLNSFLAKPTPAPATAHGTPLSTTGHPLSMALADEEGLHEDGTVEIRPRTLEDDEMPIDRSGGLAPSFDFSIINQTNRLGIAKGSGRRSASSAPTTGGNSQLIIEDGSGALGASHLVYSPMHNRLLQKESPVVVSLCQIGFSLTDTEIVLSNPSMLNAYANAVRHAGIEIPGCWNGKLVREVGYLIQNPRIEDPAAHIQKMMDLKKSSRRANVGLIAAAGSKNAASAAEQAAQDESDAQNIVLNKEQREVLDWALKGYCMYIGGSAGTGKTVLLTALKRRLTQEGLRVAMTATTGIAGCHIGGATFHHTFSVTTTDEFSNRKNLLSYDVVVIDEVSMMSRKLLEEFDDVLRHEAGINIPFGGVQVILCGDFLQLSPVNEESIIDSPTFKENFVRTRLIQQVRQSQFPEFADMLGVIRHGTCPPLLTQAIKSLPEGTMASDAINLLPTNVQVREANQRELERIDSPAYKFTPLVTEVKLEGEFTPTILLQVKADFNSAKFLMMAYDFLRQRVQLRNPRGLSLYRIFSDGYAFRISLPQTESVLWKRTLAARFLEIAPQVEKWGVGATVHNIVKEGTGLHTKEFEDNLSRLLTNHPYVQPQELKEGCRVLLRSNLTSTLVNGSVGVVKGFCPCEKEYVSQHLRADSSTDSLIEEYNNFHKVELGYPATLPLVQFSEGMPPIAIPPMSTTIGGTAATQFYCLEGISVPLTLAYAFTVHKVQGLTLVGRVHLELSKMWPCNHLLYVAMSRVKNPDQLSVSGFDPTMIVADQRAVAFDEELMGQGVVSQPPTACVAVWKGFDTYSVTKDFHLQIGSSSSNSSATSAGRKSAEEITLSSLEAKEAKIKGAKTSAISRLKYEKDSAALIDSQNGVAPADATVQDAESTGGDDAFANKSKPALAHESLFQQMAQRGAGGFKYFTQSSSGSSKDRRQELLKIASEQYISATNPIGGRKETSEATEVADSSPPADNDMPPIE